MAAMGYLQTAQHVAGSLLSLSGNITACGWIIGESKLRSYNIKFYDQYSFIPCVMEILTREIVQESSIK